MYENLTRLDLVGPALARALGDPGRERLADLGLLLFYWRQRVQAGSMAGQEFGDRAAAHGLQPVLEVVADSHPAIVLYERSGWQLACTQPATWANPDGTTPVLRGYVRPRPVSSGPGRREAAQLASRPG